MLNKRTLIFISIIAAAIFLTIGLIWYFLRLPDRGKPSIPEESEKERTIRQQLGELRQLRGMDSPLTKEEIGSQFKELQNLFKKQKPLPQDQIQKQLEEMEKLRTQ